MQQSIYAESSSSDPGLFQHKAKRSLLEWSVISIKRPNKGIYWVKRRRCNKPNRKRRHIGSRRFGRKRKRGRWLQNAESTTPITWNNMAGVEPLPNALIDDIEAYIQQPHQRRMRRSFKRHIEA
ncbi:uncharacterized protein LOC110118159 [Ceratitis capitata]|uniref:uncharacterized protein LOC110118159 n=1 Tax=Ceratitis capitata TaxID=7213 RepID=UPI000A10A5BD|nr:uncharacterized protein LOC110118159 [Ceratitis capitata]